MQAYTQDFCTVNLAYDVVSMDTNGDVYRWSTHQTPKAANLAKFQVQSDNPDHTVVTAQRW